MGERERSRARTPLSEAVAIVFDPPPPVMCRNVLLDLGGGTLSIAQLLLDCVRYNEWCVAAC